jgi:hypothetical protein
LCQEEYGIQRLNSMEEQLQILRSLATLLPGDKPIRHRLVRQYLNMDLTDETGREIRSAKKAIGNTSTLARCEIFLLMRRAEKSEGILKEDRIAMLREAERQSIRNIRLFSTDIYNYKVYGEVGIAFAKKTGDVTVLSDAITLTQATEETILDPQLTKFRREMDRQRRVLTVNKAEKKKS